ncbi:MAG: PEGA domain-containing protein [Vicinamibacterales bacterium]
MNSTFVRRAFVGSAPWLVAACVLVVPGSAAAHTSAEPFAPGGESVSGNARTPATVPILTHQWQMALEQRSRGGRPATGGAAPRGGGGVRSGGGVRGGGGGSRIAPPAQRPPASPGSGGTRVQGGSGRSAGAPAPQYTRPRDGRVATGQAVPGRPVGGGRPGSTVIVPGGFYPWGWGGLGLGGYWGRGYGFYDPWLYSGYGYGGGYYGGGYGGGSYAYSGKLKLKVKPRDAEVYVDGYYAGAVDNYDGVFQTLKLEPGPHRVEVRLDGYEPLQFEVNIQPDQKVTYKGSMRRVP